MAALALLVAASPASAATFTVDTSADNPDDVLDGACADLNGDCTLRAAIEEVNDLADLANTIDFDAGVFDAGPGSTIQLGSALPDVAESTDLEGSDCDPALSITEPCVILAGEGNELTDFDGIVFCACATGSEISGIRLRDFRTAVTVTATDGVTITGNVIETSDTGIVVSGAPDTVVETTIGADAPAGQNLISDNESDAIRVERVDGVEIAGNSGEGNGDEFIDLENPSGPGNFVITGAAEGLQAPQLTSLPTATSLSGTSEPGATIRVFTKASGDAGELKKLLATATANPAGVWTATFPAQADRQRLVATETVAGSSGPDQTSEPSEVTQILLEGPPTALRGPPATVRQKKKRGPVRVTFSFSSAADPSISAGIRFECALDGGPFLPCTSPIAVKLGRGPHSFKVRARDTIGRGGEVAESTFRVAKKKRRKKR